MNSQLKNMVLELHKNGYQVIPKDANGKNPAVKWRHYHEEGFKNSDEMIFKWLNMRFPAFCLLTGETSNNLEVLDFDTLSDKTTVFETFRYVAGDFIKDMPIVTSGGGGVHLYYKRENNAKSTKLAYKFDQGKKEENDKVFLSSALKQKRTVKSDYQIVIETRSDKSYIVAPFSLHKSGKLYLPNVSVENFVSSIPTLSESEVLKLHEIAKTFNEFVGERPTDGDKEVDSGTGVITQKPKLQRNKDFFEKNSPINWFNQDNDIDKILEKYGYTYHSQRDNNSLYYCRPERDTISIIVHIDQNRSWHFSENDELYTQSGIDNMRTPFDIFTIFEFGGDVRSAVKFLSGKYGLKKNKSMVKHTARGW